MLQTSGIALRGLGETHSDLIELAEFQRAVVVDGRPDVFAVFTISDHFQLPHTADICKPGLDLCHVQDLEGEMSYL